MSTDWKWKLEISWEALNKQLEILHLFIHFFSRWIFVYIIIPPPPHPIQRWCHSYIQYGNFMSRCSTNATKRGVKNCKSQLSSAGKQVGWLYDRSTVLWHHCRLGLQMISSAQDGGGYLGFRFVLGDDAQASHPSLSMSVELPSTDRKMYLSYYL